MVQVLAKSIMNLEDSFNGKSPCVIEILGAVVGEAIRMLRGAVRRKERRMD